MKPTPATARGQLAEASDQRLLSLLEQDYQARLRSLSRRLLEVGEQERKRLGRELHDQVGGNLSALVLGLELIRNALPRDAGTVLAKRLADFENILLQALEQVNDLLVDLRPVALDELGLLSALRHQAAVLSSRTGVRFVVAGSEPAPRLPPECEIAFYRIAQEAWTNVLKHAGATEVRVTLSQRAGVVAMCIEDDGAGFDAAARIPGLPSLGLTTMRERAEACGARLHIETTAGHGVRLSVALTRAAA